jgi:hypothetical protein
LRTVKLTPGFPILVATAAALVNPDILAEVLQRAWDKLQPILGLEAGELPEFRVDEEDRYRPHHGDSSLHQGHPVHLRSEWPASNA